MEFEPIGRLIRALLVVIVVGLALSSRGEGIGRGILTALLWTLVFHALLVVIAACFYPANEFFSALSGNDRIRDYRASGLMAGFDISGLLSAIGMALVIYDVAVAKSYVRNSICLAILFLSCFFSSRISMVIAALLFLCYVVVVLKTSDIPMRLRAGIIVPLGFLFCVLVYNSAIVFDVTLSLGLLDVDPSVAADVATRSAVQDPNDFLWMDMFFVPQSDWQVVFGTGATMPDSDVGYVTEIFRYGIVGLFFAVFIHAVFVFKAFRALGVREKRLITFVFLLMLLLTFKNNYIFVRGVFPAFLFLVSALVTCSGKCTATTLGQAGRVAVTPCRVAEV